MPEDNKIHPAPDQEAQDAGGTSSGRSWPLGHYARIATAEARRFRQGFTQENVASFLKTLIVTIPFTLLIWIYAVQETQIETPNVAIVIEVRSPDPSRTVTLVHQEEKAITCTLYGPRSKIDRFIEQRSTSSPLIIDIDPTVPLGVSTIPTLDKIRDNPVFSQAGVAVKDCLPRTLEVAVDKIVERDAKVVAPAGLLTLQKAAFNPPVVKLRGPREVLDRLSQSGRLTVTANIADLPIINTPGQQSATAVPLNAPESNGQSVTMTPTTVDATLWVKEADVFAELKSVRVEIEAPPGLLDQYKITPTEPILTSVKLVGQPDKIEQVNRQKVVAVIHIEGVEDVKNPHPITLELRYLPDGVQLAAGQNPQMSFTATERQ